MNKAIYYKGPLKMCQNGMLYEGYQLCGDCTSFVSKDMYEKEYRDKYPQIKNVVVLPKSAVAAALKGEGLRAGLLIGTRLAPLNGESLRVGVSEILPQTCSGYRFVLDAGGEAALKRARAAGKCIVGRYKTGNRADRAFSRLDNDLLNALSAGDAYCIVVDVADGGQNAFLKTEDGKEEMGVLIDDEN